MLQVTKITPIDRHLREYVNPFIEPEMKSKAKFKTNPEAEKTKNQKQVTNADKPIAELRYKAQEVVHYQPLFKKLNEQYPVTPRY